MNTKEVWTKLTDVSHFVFGWICMMLIIARNILGVYGVIVFAAYQLFDVLQGESREEWTGDIKEFLAGMGAAIIYFAVKVLGIPLPEVVV